MKPKSIEKLLQNHLKTRGFLTSMTLSAQGWNTESLDPKQLVGPQVHVYAADYPTRWSWMACIQLEAFKMIASRFHNSKAEWQLVRNGLGSHIKDAAARARATGAATTAGHEPAAASRPGEPQEWEQQMGMLLAAYSSTTKTGTAPGAITAGCHFVVLRYQTRAGETMLRPFISGAEGLGGPLHADRFDAMVSYVIGLDQQSHPEWF
ncbi:hypothetical protein [Achromobacter anxifer]|uniref:hypothetical protein n=1 Tax=Achromobacter anxifer TaxID=1287737 RepID=UPI0015904F7E|nr:hypothetical protein [Achromobacter anxifer]